MAMLFCDGFDHYAAPADAAVKWTSQGAVASQSLVTGRVSGFGVSMTGSTCNLVKSVSNVQTLVAGVAFKWSTLPSSTGSMIAFFDSATCQFTVGMNSVGQIAVYRGVDSVNLLATATVSVPATTWNYLEVKVKIASGSSGTYDVHLNGQSILSSGGANTQASANAYATSVRVYSNASQACAFDDFYLLDTTGSTNNDFLGDVRIQTLYPASDSSKQMTPLSSMGTNPYLSAVFNIVPGANFLALNKFTAPVTGTVDHIAIQWQTTNGSAKVKAVIYSDNAGVPNSLLSNGTSNEVVATTLGAVTQYTFGTPPSVTASTVYWIGFITDSAIAVAYQSTSSGSSSTKANTYASGAPASPTSMTAGTILYQVAAALTGASTNFGSVAEGQQDGDVSYVFDSTTGHKDEYALTQLAAGTATVKGIQISPLIRKTDAGGRTGRYNLKTSGSTANGTTQSPGTSYAYYPQCHDVQADGSTAWTASAVNSATVQVELVA